MSMKDKFPGFYRPTKAEFDRLWKEGWFVFDTNVLLNPYRYAPDTREDLLKVMEEVHERTWIPHHVALEYQRKRVRVIADQHGKFVKMANDVSFAKFRNLITSGQTDRMR